MNHPGRSAKNITTLLSRYAIIWLVTSLGLAFSITAFWMLNQQFINQKGNEFSWVAHNRSSLLKQGMQGALEPVRMLQDYLHASESVTVDQFRLLATPLLSRNSGIEMLGLILEEQDKNGSVGQAQDSTGHQQSTSYSTLTYAEGSANTQFRQGYDMSTQAGLMDAIDNAQQAGKLAVSGRIEIVSQNDNKYGVMACLPLYMGGVHSSASSSEPKKLFGFVVAVLRLDELAHAAISKLEPRGVDLLIQDQSAEGNARFLELYASRLSSSDMLREVQVADWLASNTMLRIDEVQMGNRIWSITAAPNQNFRSAEAFENGPLVVLLAGILLTLLLSTYLLKIKFGSQERQRMNQALEDREELFRQMTETVDDVFWALPLDRSHFLYVSPALESMWGIECQRVYEDPELFSRAIHSDDLVKWREALDSASQGSESMEFVYRVIRPDGTQRWIQDNAFPIRNPAGETYRLVGIAEDITEKKLAEDALRDSETKLQTIFNQSPDRIMTVDSSGTILLMNWGATLEFPDTRGEEDSAGLLPDAYRDDYRQQLARAFQNGEVSYLQYQADDTASWWETRIIPVIENGEVSSSMVIATDITEKRNLQAQAIRNARLASIGVLATGVAHEINNPNNAIQISAALYMRVWHDAMPVLREYYREQGDFSLGGLSFAEEGASLGGLISDIQDNSRRIKTIVENLKHLGKKDHGTLDEDINVNAVLQTASEVLQSSIRIYTDNWAMELAEDLPLVRGNFQQLEQVFMNIMLNALQSLPDKKHGVRVVSLADPDGKSVLIRIVDQGIGIKDEDMTSITEPFFTTRLESGGTGLGLSISNTIIEDHLGSMTFDSTEGKGTEVCIRIPAHNRISSK